MISAPQMIYASRMMGTDIISCLRSKYIMRRTPYIIKKCVVSQYNSFCTSGIDEKSKRKLLTRDLHLWYQVCEETEMIMEEAGRFFSGSITAKQAAEYTQNRISIYLAEQS